MSTGQDIHGQRLLVVDFGSQYTQLIARRVREAGVYCEIHPFDAPESFLREFSPQNLTARLDLMGKEFQDMLNKTEG